MDSRMPLSRALRNQSHLDAITTLCAGISTISASSRSSLVTGWEPVWSMTTSPFSEWNRKYTSMDWTLTMKWEGVLPAGAMISKVTSVPWAECSRVRACAANLLSLAYGGTHSDSTELSYKSRGRMCQSRCMNQRGWTLCQGLVMRPVRGAYLGIFGVSSLLARGFSAETKGRDTLSELVTLHHTASCVDERCHCAVMLLNLVQHPCLTGGHKTVNMTCGGQSSSNNSPLWMFPAWRGISTHAKWPFHPGQTSSPRSSPKTKGPIEKWALMQEAYSDAQQGIDPVEKKLTSSINCSKFLETERIFSSWDIRRKSSLGREETQSYPILSVPWLEQKTHLRLMRLWKLCVVFSWNLFSLINSLVCRAWNISTKCS